MNLPDMHIHSEHSFDSKTTMTDLCNQAVANGIPEVCFAEHFSLDEWVPTYGHMDWRRYGSDINYNRRHIAGRLVIHKGIELCEPHLDLAGYREIAERETLDYVIGSIHNVNQLKLRWVLRDYGRQSGYDLYFREVLFMVEKADIDAVAHLDLIKRYANEKFSELDFARHKPVITQILEKIIERGLVLEINSSSLSTLGETMPTVDILKLYRQLGGELITFGSDAHKPERVGLGLEDARKIALACDFKTYCTFQSRQRIEHPL